MAATVSEEAKEMITQQVHADDAWCSECETVVVVSEGKRCSNTEPVAALCAQE